MKRANVYIVRKIKNASGMNELVSPDFTHSSMFLQICSTQLYILVIIYLRNLLVLKEDHSSEISLIIFLRGLFSYII